MISQVEPDYKRRNREFFQGNAAELLLGILPAAKPQPRLPILDWAEKHLRIPSGKLKGQRFRRSMQPCTSVFLELVDDPRYRLAVLVGPNQQGKSYAAATVILNSLINWKDDTIFGLPDLDGMWSTKWATDIEPMLRRSDFSEMLPESGEGSRGGTPKLLKLTNGRRLQAMGAGGEANQRAGAQCRVLVITELKDFGTATKKSGEGDKAQQLLRRTLQHQGNEFAMAESTLTSEDNIAYQWYLNGTQTQAFFECPHCSNHISLCREDLVGWQTAANENEARENARFRCGKCDETMTEAERKTALQSCIALHKGQTIVDGVIEGDHPPTATLSFRFGAGVSMFSDAGTLAVAEFKYAHMAKGTAKGNAYRELMQSMWGLPVSVQSFAVDALDGMALMQRVGSSAFGKVPDGTILLTGGCDVRKSTLHASVIAWRQDAGPVVIWWGSEPIREGVLWKDGLCNAGAILQKRFSDGFECSDGERLPVLFTLLDAGWQTWDVEALSEMDFTWQSMMGFGSGVLSGKSYRAPKQTGNSCRLIGENFHVAMVQDRQLVELDADKHKSTLASLMRLPVDDPQALTFASADTANLKFLCDHLTGEVEVPKTDGGESLTTWREVRSEQHLLDSTSYAIAARSVYDALQELLAGQQQQPDEIEWEPVVHGQQW